MAGRKQAGTSVALRQVRIRAVAAGKAAGKTHREIASELGLSKVTVDQIAAKPECKRELRELLAPHYLRLGDCAEAAIEAIQRALRARKEDEEDHHARMAAVGRFRDLVELATRPEVTGELPEGAVYLEELERRRTVLARSEPSARQQGETADGA